MTHHVVLLTNLLLQMHHGLEEIVIEPHLLIERVHGFDLFRGIQSDGSEILAHQRRILLLHEAIVIFLKGTAATKRQARDGLSPEAHQVLIEEFRTIIRMQFLHPKGQPLQNPTEAAFHCLLRSSQNRHPLAPSRCHIDQLQGMRIDALRTVSSMMDQIDLEMARLRRLPRDASHGDWLAHLVGPLWPFLWLTLLAAAIL